jgi:hypothetical protein
MSLVDASGGVKPILLSVLIPGIQLRKVSVAPTTHLSALAHAISKTEVTLIFRGEILNFSQTFADYGMCDHDSIVAIPARDASHQIHPKWLRMSQNEDYCEQVERACQAVGGRREYMRMRDLALLKTECYPRQFRKLVRARCAGPSLFEPESPDSLTVVPDSPSEISTEPLPFVW